MNLLKKCGEKCGRFRVWCVAAAAGVVASAAAPALAQSTPPSMTDITFPVNVTSVVTVIAAAGGLILLAYIGVPIAFRMIHKLAGRLSKSVG